MAKCNLSAEEREAALRLPEWGAHSTEDWDILRDQFSQYLFLQKDAEGMDWWSSCCRSMGFEVGRRGRLYKLKHNDITTCPECGRQVQVKNLGRIRSGAKLHETLPISFVELSADGAVLIESGVGMWDFDYEHDMCETFWAKHRYYIAPGKVQEWKRPMNPDMWGCSYKPGQWEPTANVREPFQTNIMYGFDGYGQFIGLDKVKGSALRYCAIEQYYEEYHNVDVFDPRTPVRLVPQYLAEYAMRPAMEMLSKLGMHEFIGSLIRDGITNGHLVNWKAKSPYEFCKMTKAEYNELRRVLTPVSLRVYRELKRDGMVKNAREALPILSFDREADISKLISICRRVGADIVKAGRYITKHTQGRMYWLDYIEMAIKLGYDLSDETVLFPKNLAERHDAAVETIKHQTDAEAAEAYKKRRKMLEKKYGFEMGGYRIIVPESAQAIINEGQTLHHCVGGYAKRHVDGKTTILFMRKARTPGRSFMTIELDEKGSLRQIHGYKNERYPHAVSPLKSFGWFIDMWQKWYRRGSRRGADGKPMIEEEKTA